MRRAWPTARLTTCLRCTPGEFLHDELQALDLSARGLAKHLGVPPNTVTTILNGDRGISARMALRLARAFGTSEQYWLNLQNIYDTKLARAELDVTGITPLVAA